MAKLEGRVALVTGGASGIGRATALALSKAGAKVVVADVKRSGGEETVRLVQAAGGEAVFFSADVAHAEQVNSLIDKVVATFGGLDCACNSAGIAGIEAGTADCTEDNWERTITVNLKGVWLCMKYEIPQMLKQGKGAIVNIASVAGLVGLRGWPAYVASKHGVLGLTKSGALEYAEKGIRINAVCPSIVRTNMAESFTRGDARTEKFILAQQPLGRMGTPEEVAAAVVWLCSDESSFVTGHGLVLDGGLLAH
jgi:NAD(P)-dependent dehydrogenase (short-subunit alcohol dehydrogenase family)